MAGCVLAEANGQSIICQKIDAYWEAGQMAIKALEAEPKKGKWKDSVLGMDGYYANCSECGYQIDVHENRGYPNYCENCGADMRGDAE